MLWPSKTQCLDEHHRDDVAGKYVNDLLSLEYKWLNDSQKEVFDLIKQMLPKIWETNTFMKALFPSQPNRIPKSEHKHGATNINVMNTEKVKLKSGQKVIMSIEQHLETELKTVDK